MSYDDIIMTSLLITLFSEHPIWQSIGILWTVVVSWAFLFKKESHFRLLLWVGQWIFATHFLMIWAISWALTFGLSSVRTIWSTYIRKEKIDYFVFIWIFLIFWILRFQSFIDILPMLMGMISTTSLFFFTGLKWRMLFLVSVSGFLVYNIIVWSIGGIINEFLVLAINFITILRMIFQKNTKSPTI